MTDERKYYEEDEYEEIDVTRLLSRILVNWKKLLLWCLGGIVFGIVIAFSIPDEFTSEAKLAPEYVSNSRNSGLGALASMAGVSVGGTTVDSMGPDIYPDIVVSTPFMVELFDVPVSFSYKQKSVETTLYDYVLNYIKEPWWITLKKLPAKWIARLKHPAKKKSQPASSSSGQTIDPTSLTGRQNKAVQLLRKCISLNTDKKNNVISIKVVTQNPKVSAVLAAEVTQRLQEWVTKYRTDKARHDLDYYQQLFDEARDNYYQAQQKYARYVDANQGVVLQRVKIEEQRLQNESNLAYQVYNNCAQQLQVAKAKVQMETPVCSVIQPPVVPNRPGKPKRGTLVVLFAFMAVVFEIVWLLFGKEWFHQLKSDGREERDSALAPGN